MFNRYSKKFLICIFFVIIIFSIDRISKLYILNLAETEKYVDIYFNMGGNTNITTLRTK